MKDKLLKIAEQSKSNLKMLIPNARELDPSTCKDIIGQLQIPLNECIEHLYADKWEEDFVQKIDIFDNTIVKKFMYGRDGYFQDTLVYHVEYENIVNTHMCKPIQEYIVLKLDTSKTGVPENLSSNTQDPSRFLPIIDCMLAFSDLFISTLHESRLDNIKYTSKWLRNQGLRDILRHGQAYTIISQSSHYTSALLVTPTGAAVYNLPTQILSDSKTHIEQILCLENLKQQAIPDISINNWTTDNMLALANSNPLFIANNLRPGNSFETIVQ